ncbi:MAG: M48 family metalloprotease [Alphaproteobacteria bacterium]
MDEDEKNKRIYDYIEKIFSLDKIFIEYNGLSVVSYDPNEFRAGFYQAVVVLANKASVNTPVIYVVDKKNGRAGTNVVTGSLFFSRQYLADPAVTMDDLLSVAGHEMGHRLLVDEEVKLKNSIFYRLSQPRLSKAISAVVVATALAGFFSLPGKHISLTVCITSSVLLYLSPRMVNHGNRQIEYGADAISAYLMGCAAPLSSELDRNSDPRNRYPHRLGEFFGNKTHPSTVNRMAHLQKVGENIDKNGEVIDHSKLPKPLQTKKAFQPRP